MQMSANSNRDGDEPPLTVDEVQVVGTEDAPATAESSTAIDPTSVDPIRERVLAKGMPAADLDALIAKHGPQVVPAVDALLRTGKPLKFVTDTLIAAERAGLARETIELLASGRFERPAGILKIVREAETKPGSANQIRTALDHVRDGSRVSVEGVKHDPAIAESGEADLVDYTERSAYQLKMVTGKGRYALRDNFDDAIAQLRGERGEILPDGFERIAELRLVNPELKQYTAGKEELIACLREDSAAIRSDDDITIVIHNGNGRIELTMKDLVR